MFRLSKNGNIELTRGDTCKIPILLNFGDRLHPEIYEMKDGDNFYFSIMQPHETFETAIIKKKLNRDCQSEGFVIVKISSADTQTLLPGRYYYTAKLTYKDNDGDDCVKTIVPECEFYIL